MSLLLALNNFTNWSGVSIVGSEQLQENWVYNKEKYGEEYGAVLDVGRGRVKLL